MIISYSQREINYLVNISQSVYKTAQIKGHFIVKVSLLFMSLFHAILLEQIFDLLVRIDDLADGNIMVDSLDKVCDIL